MLNERHERFIQEYLVDLNAAQAAIRAGYAPRTARFQASVLLTNPNIQAEIGKRQAELQAEVQVRQRDVLQEYLRLAYCDMRQVATWGPDGVELIDSALLDDNAARAVQEVTSTKKTFTRITADGEALTTTEVNTKVKLYNKQAALHDLAAHLHLFGDGKSEMDEAFLLGFVEVVKHHAGSEDTRAAILGYLRRYLGAVAA